MSQTHGAQTVGSRYRSYAKLCILIIVFAASYTQAPLYTSNQNTYFLHGLSNGGFGFLANDWMANTADAFPVFSALVNVTYSGPGSYFFYIYHILLQGIFIYSILGISTNAWNINRSDNQYLTFFILAAGLCSLLFSNVSSLFSGFSLYRLFSWGMANQYILGPLFQPSTFGVFLLLSVMLFLRGKRVFAITALGVAINVHASYLLSAAALTVSYMAIVYLEEKRLHKPLLLGLISLILALPIVAYAQFTFSATSPELMRSAQEILVDYRFPHHAKIHQWFGITEALQIGIVLLALVIHRRKRIFLIILIPFLIGVVLTVIQLLTKNYFLALLFPWRISSFLIPLSAFAVVGSAVSYFFEAKNDWLRTYAKQINNGLISILIVLLLSGVFMTYSRLNDDRLEEHDEYSALVEYIKTIGHQDELYVIPIGWQDFRFQTGMPIVVDHKTHPYKDIEVIEWYERIKTIENFYEAAGAEICEAVRKDLSRYRATHIVIVDKDIPIDCSALNKIFEAGNTKLYKIVEGP